MNTWLMQTWRHPRVLLPYAATAAILLTVLGCAGTHVKTSDASIPPEKRLANARKTIASHPNDPAALYQMGNALFDLQRYQDAVAAYEGVLALEPKNASAHVNLGLTLKRLNRLPQAIEHYHAALAIEPDDIITLHDLAAALESKGDLEEADATLVHLLALQPDNVQVLSRHANLLFKASHYDEAAKVFEKVMKLDPGLSEDYYNFGLCYFYRDQNDAALSTWLAALAHEPRNRAVNKGLAVLYWKRHEYKQSWDAVAKCLSMGIPMDPDFLENLRKDSGVSGPDSTPAPGK